MTDVQTGTCACGASVEREVMSGPMARWFNDRPFSCEACAAVEQAEAEAQEARDEDDRRRRDTLRRIDASGLPVALRGLTFDALDRDPGRVEGIESAISWAATEIPGVLFEGAVGTGKTRIAAAAANHMLHTRNLHWVSTPLLCAHLAAGFGTTTRERALGVLTSTTSLVLDDLDKTRPTAVAAEQLFLAIDHRIENRVPLAVTTNLSLAEIATRYDQPFGEAIASRLAGYCARHTITGVDRRMAS